jgi:hypothetical protein
MTPRTPAPSRRPRLAAAGLVVLTLVATGAATDAGSAAPGTWTRQLDPTAARASAASVDVASSALKVVSTTGHHLRLRMLAFRTSSGTQIVVAVESHNQAEEHDWTFKVPDTALSLSTKGRGRIHLTSRRSAGYAIVSLKASPSGPATVSRCQGKVATRTRHLSLSGTLLLRTRSTGKRAWGAVGSSHRTLHFSTRSKVTWVRDAATNCPTPTIACRSTFLWQASVGSFGDAAFLTSDNVGAHAEIGGLRSVPLTKPAGATRSDLVTLPDSSSNQLIVNSDGSATMQATFRGGTATLTAPQPASTDVAPCGNGTRNVSVEFWSASFANGPTPIHVPAQIFGGFSASDTPAAGFARVTLLP